MRASLTREFFIPAGAAKIAHKASDAVAYVYADHLGRPCARLFVGRQRKPLWAVRFPSSAKREQAIREAFTTRAVTLQGKAARRAADQARDAERAESVVVGDILNACWGYEQTNHDFYEVIARSGAMVTLRKLATVRQDSPCWGHFRVVPQSGSYTAEPIRRRLQGDGVRITSYAWARKWNTKTVAGVPVGPAMNATDYA